MNIFGLGGVHHSQPQQTDSASSSSAVASPEPSGRRLQRQDALPTNNRYHASQLPGTPQRARLAARYAPQASSSSTAGSEHAGPSMALSRQPGQRENRALASFHHQMQQSAKITRGDPLPEQLEMVPKRLQQKIDSVNLPQLKKLNKDLYNYGKKATELAKAGSAANCDLMTMDIELLPLLADAENVRNPGLNLHTFKNPQECYQAIKDQYKSVQDSKQPLNMRAIYPPVKYTTQHQIALDIQLKPGHRPSIIAIESSLSNLAGPIKMELQGNLRGAKIQILENSIQKSQWDCSMYALSNALKSFKHFDDYTARLHNGEQGVPIPAEFLKHSQSKTYIEGHPHQDSVVTKDKGGLHAETLLHRNLAYRVERDDIAYSTSIEGFRLQEIQRAGEFLVAQKHKR